jgi:hypothetical protein
MPASTRLDTLHRRAQAVRTRALVRRWRYRQRHLAGGVWFRLRRVLADARYAFAISEEDARRLVNDGCVVESVGLEIAPEKTMMFVDEGRLATLATRRPITVGLGPDFLAAAAIALVPFDSFDRKAS